MIQAPPGHIQAEEGGASHFAHPLTSQSSACLLKHLGSCNGSRLKLLHGLKPAVKTITRPGVTFVKYRMLLRLEENSASLSVRLRPWPCLDPTELFVPKGCTFLGLQLLWPVRDAVIWRGDWKQVQLHSSGTELCSLFLLWGCSIALGWARGAGSKGFPFKQLCYHPSDSCLLGWECGIQ